RRQQLSQIKRHPHQQEFVASSLSGNRHIARALIAKQSARCIANRTNGLARSVVGCPYRAANNIACSPNGTADSAGGASDGTGASTPGIVCAVAAWAIGIIA